MMFFQMGLLLGYFYAHVLATKLPPKRQVILHLVLLTLSLVLMPIGVPKNWHPDTLSMPSVEIFCLLSVAVGIPFILLSASGPLLQHWFASTQPNQSPFRLYAVSNLGSLIALVSYPFLIEPMFTIKTQAFVWSGGYVVLLVFFAVCGRAFYKKNSVDASTEFIVQNASAVKTSDKILWVALAACGSTLLLAITNQISQNIAVVPFLWILPLTIYLITFIICFERDAWYQRYIMLVLVLVSLGFLVPMMFEEFSDEWNSIVYQICVYSFALFTCCMVCHGELARSRSSVKNLTTFYLYVALGGAVGGVFVTIVSPLLFSGYWELHIGLVTTLLLVGLCMYREQKNFRKPVQKYFFFTLWPILTTALMAALMIQVGSIRETSLYVNRSFFGVIFVEQWTTEAPMPMYVRGLSHGSIQHGVQYMNPTFDNLATTYYGPYSGSGLALRHHPKRSASDVHDRGLTIGAVGMGVGTISMYTNEQDQLRYYEINPEVENIAKKYFRYLANGKAKTQIVLGDARISLEHELDENKSNKFDVLVLDAFSGDSIPVHLLTEEAFDIYNQHLADDGIIAIHISNRYLDLRPVMIAPAKKLGMQMYWVENFNLQWFELQSDWIILTRNSDFVQAAKLQPYESLVRKEDLPQFHWTDDYSNLFAVIDWKL
ncbi:MAG: fused MFS/spermidine synthase [Bdellovibrionales bacterium]|nr:fused MFS/spermidine synthase [Bdellovibrionales bacterium]